MHDDTELTREEAEAALAGWLGRPVSLKIASRRAGLPCIRKRGSKGLYFRFGDLREWADSRPFGKGARVDVRGTALGDWLFAQRTTMWQFSRRLQIPEQIVAAMCRRPRKSWYLARLPGADILQLISLETGIPEEALTADALHTVPKAEAAE